MDEHQITAAELGLTEEQIVAFGIFTGKLIKEQIKLGYGDLMDEIEELQSDVLELQSEVEDISDRPYLDGFQIGIGFILAIILSHVLKMV